MSRTNHRPHLHDLISIHLDSTGIIKDNNSLTESSHLQKMSFTSKQWWKTKNLDSRLQIETTEEVIQRYYGGKSIFNRLNRKRIHLIVVQPDNYLTRSILKSTISTRNELIRQLNTVPNIIHPFSKFRFIWDHVMCLVYLNVMILFPYDTIFRYKAHKIAVDEFRWWAIILNWICLIDIVLNFNTGYYGNDNQQIVLCRRSIAKRYLKYYFWVDVISSAPLIFVPFFEPDIYDGVVISSCIKNNLFHPGCIFDLFNMLTLLKGLRLPTLVTYLHRTITKSFTFFRAFRYRLFKMVLILLIVFHWLATFDLTVTRLTSYGYNGIDYLDRTHNHSMTTFEQYVHSMYHAACTVALFGSITPRDQTYFVLMATLLEMATGYILRIYLIAQLLMFSKTLFSTSVQFYQNRHQMTQYMKYRQLPHPIRKRLLNYYDFRFQNKYYKEPFLLNILGDKLKQEITVERGRHLVSSVHFFKNLPTELIIHLAHCLRAEVYIADDVIIKAGDLGDAMYFIINGTVAVYLENGEEVAHLKDGDHFGEIALIADNDRRTAYIVAVENCDLFVLGKLLINLLPKISVDIFI